MSSYSEKLKDPRWQKKRLEIMNRDEFKCVRCESKDKTLHVHHLWYLPGMQPWEYDDDDYQTLCHECHEEQSYYTRVITRIISGLPVTRQLGIWGYVVAHFRDAVRHNECRWNGLEVDIHPKGPAKAGECNYHRVPYDYGVRFKNKDNSTDWETIYKFEEIVNFVSSEFVERLISKGYKEMTLEDLFSNFETIKETVGSIADNCSCKKDFT